MKMIVINQLEFMKQPILRLYIYYQKKSRQTYLKYFEIFTEWCIHNDKNLREEVFQAFFSGKRQNFIVLWSTLEHLIYVYGLKNIDISKY